MAFKSSRPKIILRRWASFLVGRNIRHCSLKVREQRATEIMLGENKNLVRPSPHPSGLKLNLCTYSLHSSDKYHHVSFASAFIFPPRHSLPSSPSFPSPSFFLKFLPPSFPHSLPSSLPPPPFFSHSLPPPPFFPHSLPPPPSFPHSLPLPLPSLPLLPHQ